MSESKFSGVITALVTPFYEGEVDFASFDRLVDFQLDQGVAGFVINGTTAESPTLEISEVEELFRRAREKAASRQRPCTLILGTGSNSTKKTIETTRFATQWKADAALVVTPYYNKPPQRGLVEHFKAVAESSEVPVLLYNVPGRTITSLAVETIAELAKHPRIIGIKEATGDMVFGQEILGRVGENFVVTSGDDATCMDLAARGGQGVISVCSHVIGAEMVPLVERARRGDEKSIEEFSKFHPFINQLYTEANPIPVKMALYLMGIIRSPEMRLPLVSLNEAHSKTLSSALKDLGKI